MCLQLVFRRAQDECTHNRNEICALCTELIFCEIPGKLVQGPGGAEGLDGLILIAPGDSMGGRVAGIAGPPTGLRFLRRAF